MRRFLAHPVVIVAIFAAIIGLFARYISSITSLDDTFKVKDCTSIGIIIDSRDQRGDEVPQDYRDRYEELCSSNSVPADPGPSEVPTPGQTPTAALPTSVPTVSPEVCDDLVFYANMGDKSSDKAYGPLTAQSPDLHGKPMSELNADEAAQELMYVVKCDPTIAASTAVYLGVRTDLGVNALAREYIEDHAKRSEDVASISDRLSGMTRQIVMAPAGSLITTADAEPGDVPMIGVTVIKEGQSSPWLVFTDEQGETRAFRQDCHDQPELTDAEAAVLGQFQN